MPVYGLQVEAYGLTANQRQNAANRINNVISGRQYHYANVEPEYQRRGETLFFCEINGLQARADGDAVFENIRSWLSTRSEDSPVTGEHSYCRLTEKRTTARTNTIWRAESPGWVTVETTQDLDSLSG